MKNQIVAMRKILFVCICIFAVCFCLPADAAGARKTVRVGCVDIGNFLVINSDGYARGYGAEYLSEIAKYTGWKYEYKTGSWEDCMKWLKSGEIDLLLPAEYSEDRAKDFLFSDVECCIDYVALLGIKSDNSYYYEDYEAFNGMTIGMIRGNYLNLIFNEFAQSHEFSFKAKYYNTGNELLSALNNKEVGAIVNGNLEYLSSQKLLARIDYMPAYFVTAINNKPLMVQLDEALHEIFLNNPYYTAELHSKYYQSIDRQAIGFTRQESEYIKQRKEIRVLINRNRYPMEWYDENKKECRGIYVDALKLVEAESGLKFKFIANEDGEEPWTAIENGDADVWGGAYSTAGGNGFKGLDHTISYYDDRYSLVGRQARNISLSDSLTISVLNKEMGLAKCIEEFAPQWKIVGYDNFYACLNSVKQSKSDLAAVNFWSLSIDGDAIGSDLSIVDGNTLNQPIFIGVKNEDEMLASVLNKAILRIDKRAFQEAAANSVLSLQKNPTFGTVLKNNPRYAIITTIILFIILMGVLFILYRSFMREKQNMILQIKNQELAEAVVIQEQLRKEAQTDSLTGLKNKSTIEQSCQDCLNKYPKESHAIMVMDLDDFKRINDTHGHLYGDTILKAFGHILLKASEEEDIVGRIGGDEFLMFMACVEDKAQIKERVKRLYSNMAESAEELKEWSEAKIGCSIGITISRTPHEKFNELFLKADKALYEAKNSGKNRYFMVSDEEGTKE